MAIKLGNIDITKLHLGSNLITKAYLGTTLILQSTVPVLDLTKTHETSNSIGMSWQANASYSHSSIKRDGVEIYKGTDLKFIDHLRSPSTTHNYRLYRHDGIAGTPIGDDIDYPLSSSAIQATYYAETTAYMNAISVPNNSTIYWDGTPQSITGAEVWTSINETVHYFKTYNIWSSNLILWNPVFGTTDSQIAINIKDVADYKLTLQGIVTINSLGIKTDGAKTSYGEWVRTDGISLLKGNDLVKEIMGFTCTAASVSPSSTEIEIGISTSESQRYLLSANIGAFGGAVFGVGTTATGISLLPVEGVYTGFYNEGLSIIFKNGALRSSSSAGTSQLPSSFANHRFGSIGVVSDTTNYSSKKTISSPYYATGINNNYDALTINKGMEIWENYTKRKTW